MADHPWLKSYPDGVRWDAELPMLPVQQLLDDAVARWPEHPALEFMGRTLSYREFGALADRAAKGLQQLGVKPGVHVGLYLPNSPHYPIAFFGVLKAGGTVVNYSPLDAERVLEHKIENSETDVLVTLDLAALYPQMARLLGRSRLKKLVVGNLADFALQPEAVRAHLEKAGQLSAVATDDKHLSFDALLANDGRFTAHAIDPKDTVVVLQYTGGTTGLPKGAMLTHANLTAACAQYLESTKGDPPILVEGVERALVVLPLFHIYALSVNLLFGVRLGALLVLHTRFDLDAVLQDLAAKKISVFAGVPTMYTAIINQPKAKELDLRSLKFCGSGGAPLPVEVAQRFFALTGCQLNEGWGMTETSPTGTFTPARGMRKAGSCGMPLPGIELKFEAVGKPGQDAVPGRAGRDVHPRPQRDEGLLEERRGDAGIDDRGRLLPHRRHRLHGRRRLRLHRRPQQGHAAVRWLQRLSARARGGHLRAPVGGRGLRDRRARRLPRPVAEGLRRAEARRRALRIDELKLFLKDRLGKHEMVQELEIRAELPKTPIGKLSKKDLVDEEARKRAA